LSAHGGNLQVSTIGDLIIVCPDELLSWAKGRPSDDDQQVTGL